MTNIASASLEPRASEQGDDELSLDLMRPGRFVLEAMQQVWPGEVGIYTLLGAQCTVGVFDWIQELGFKTILLSKRCSHLLFVKLQPVICGWIQGEKSGQSLYAFWEAYNGLEALEAGNRLASWLLWRSV
jgi:hypothetical protein